MGHCDVKIGDIIEIIDKEDNLSFLDNFYLVEYITISSACNGFDLTDPPELLRRDIVHARGIGKMQNVAWFTIEDKNIKWKIASS